MRARLLVSVAVLAATATSSAQSSRAPQEIGWIGLYADALIGWLENENRLGELCPETAMHLEDLPDCRAAKLAARPFVLPAWGGPDTSTPAGAILLLATPGRGLRFFHVTATGGNPREFEPDLNLDDWGYGPYYHQTFLERRGHWFRLPADPFPSSVWIDARDLGDEPHVLLLEAGDIVSSPQGNLVILGVEPDRVRARPEQPADFWCHGAPPPAPEPWIEIRLRRDQLYDANGHLLVAPAYMKGC